MEMTGSIYASLQLDISLFSLGLYG